MFGWFFAVAMVLGGEVATISPGLDAVSRGDVALYDGDRGGARSFYFEAIAAGEPVAESMARLRLLGLAGNLGAVVHGPKLEEALSMCTGDWCILARSDYHRLVPVALGADRSEALRLALSVQDVLPGPALARVYLLTGDERAFALLQEQAALDGLGQAVLSWKGELPPLPGTWFLGGGVSGGAGLGVGGNAVFFHPDLFWKRWWLESAFWLSSRGVYGGRFLLVGPGRLAPKLSGSASDGTVDFYQGSTRTPRRIRRAETDLGPVLRIGHWELGIPGSVSLTDGGGGWQRTAGVGVEVELDRRTGRGQDLRGARFSVEAHQLWGDFEHLSVFGDSRAYFSALGGMVGTRLTFQGAFIEGAPVWMLPTVGGSELHRGAWYGRWRAPRIATIDLEQRWRILPWFGGVIFGNAAWVQDAGLHPGLGTGIRLVLPPEDWNIVRLDVGVSDTGWSLTAGWGEVF